MSTLLSDTALNRTLSRLDRQTAPRSGLRLPVPYLRRRAPTSATVFYTTTVILFVIAVVVIPLIAEQTLFTNPT